MGLSLRLTPQGHLVPEEREEAVTLPADQEARLREALERGTGQGLLQLGAGEVGQVLPPVLAFWRVFGQAWNLVGRVHFNLAENRIPRGSTYVRNGSVVDLQVAPGEVSAQVAGSRLYRVRVGVQPVPDGHWACICNDFAGAVPACGSERSSQTVLPWPVRGCGAPVA
jgi:hypothetical protein